MKISLPDSLKVYVDEQVAGRGFGTSSEYVRELIRVGIRIDKICVRCSLMALAPKRAHLQTRLTSTTCASALATATEGGGQTRHSP
jgi:hypothetical protein